MIAQVDLAIAPPNLHRHGAVATRLYLTVGSEDEITREDRAREVAT